jgi:hypothetical protein
LINYKGIEVRLILGVLVELFVIVVVSSGIVIAPILSTDLIIAVVDKMYYYKIAQIFIYFGLTAAIARQQQNDIIFPTLV